MSIYANERRAEIVKILESGKKEQVKNLAFHFGVSVRTIKNDILLLTAEYPIETLRGHDGGVRMMKDYHNTYRNDITQEQQELLISLIPIVDKHGEKLLKELLYVHGSVRLKERIEGVKGNSFTKTLLPV